VLSGDLDVAPGQVRGRVGAVDETGVQHAGRLQYVLAHIVFEVLAGQHLDHAPQQYIAVVAVLLLAAGYERRCALAVQRHHVGQAAQPGTVGGVLGAEQLVDVAGTGTVGQQLAHCHCVGEGPVGIVLQHRAQGGVQRDAPGSYLLQDRHAGEHLAGRGQVETVIGLQCKLGVGFIAWAIGLVQQDPVAVGHQHHAGESAGGLQAQGKTVQLRQCAGIRGLSGAGKGRQHAQQQAGCGSAQRRWDLLHATSSRMCAEHIALIGDAECGAHSG